MRQQTIKDRKCTVEAYVAACVLRIQNSESLQRYETFWLENVDPEYGLNRTQFEEDLLAIVEELKKEGFYATLRKVRWLHDLN